MKNYRLLFILLCVSILSGCGIAKGVTRIALMPVQLATAVIDGVTGKRMDLSGKLDDGVNEAFKPGSKMESQAIKSQFSGTTFYYSTSYVAFLKADGTALLKQNKNDTVEQAKWTTSTGQLCINKDCHEIRVKNKELLIGSATYKKGDAESLTAKLEAQLKQEAEKRAEAERKAAEEKVARERAEAEQKLAQQKYEAEQKLAQQKAEAEEKRCQASAKCRAQKEKEQREATARHAKEEAEACAHVYAGKTYTEYQGIIWGNVSYTVVGFSSYSRKVTVKRGYPYHDTKEVYCSDVPK